MSVYGAVLAGGRGLVGTTGRTFGQHSGYGDTPKELLPVGEMPIAYYAVMNQLLSGVEEVFCVVSAQKEDAMKEGLYPYFGNDSRMEYVNQGEPGGTAHAVACLADKIKDGDSLIVTFGDRLFWPPDALCPLIEGIRDGDSILLGTFGVDANETHQHGIVESDGSWVQRIHEKPHNYGKPGRAVCAYRFDTGKIFDAAREVEARPEDTGIEEQQLSCAVDGLIDICDVREVPLDSDSGCREFSIKSPEQYRVLGSKITQQIPATNWEKYFSSQSVRTEYDNF